MRVLFYYPDNPAQPVHGAQRRALEMLAAMRAHGWTVRLLSSRVSSFVPWDAGSEARLGALGVSVGVYRPGSLHRKIRRWGRRVDRWLGRRHFAPPWETAAPMRRWFAREVEAFAPDVLLMAYCAWDGLVDHGALAGVFRVIDMHDLYSLNRAMYAALERAFSSQDGTPRPDAEAHALDEAYFARLGAAVDPRELAIYDRYDRTIAISPAEARIVSAATHRTEVVLLPMSFPAPPPANTHAGPALFASGPNVFNLQAYWYFVRRVLPDVRVAAPEFLLRVTGRFASRRLPPEPAGVVHSGALPDLDAVYRTARFAICPLIGGTGQKVKIVEAMARGVPVVALRAGAGESGVVDGENGFLVDTADAFAERTVQLWRDRELCRRLGSAARETILTSYSHERFVREVGAALEPRRAGPSGTVEAPPRAAASPA